MMTTATADAGVEIGAGRLWYGVLIGAFAWKLQLMVNYSLVTYACSHGMSILIHAASALTFALALTGAWVALDSWRRSGGDFRSNVGGALGRSRFLAMSGLVASPFFALIILGQWIPNLVLSPCDGLL